MRRPQSRIRDVRQASRGKLGNLRCTPAGFTAATLDGYGLRGHLPTRPVATASYPVLVHRAASSLWLPSDDASQRRPCPELTVGTINLRNTHSPSNQRLCQASKASFPRWEFPLGVPVGRRMEVRGKNEPVAYTRPTSSMERGHTSLPFFPT